MRILLVGAGGGRHGSGPGAACRNGPKRLRDGASLTVAGYDFAAMFPVWTAIEECLNPPVLIPRWIQARRVTFKHGLGAEFVGVLRTLHTLGLDSASPVQVGGASVPPRGGMCEAAAYG